MPVRVFSRPWVLAIIALLLLVAECTVFHLGLPVAVHAVELLALFSVLGFWLWRKVLTTRELISTTLTLFIATLVYFAIYNLQQFHYTSDGGIVWRGLFGVDIPFLAGEVHGLRNFGELRDLHQSAIPWHYHDAIYRLLASFDARTTLADLAFAAPLAGYTLLALSVFTLLFHITKQRSIAWMAVLVWFVAGGFAGLDPSSYALSPSFVFSSVLFVNIILAIVLAREESGSRRWAFIIVATLLAIVLAETKITSFLALTAGLLMLSFVNAIRRSWRNAFECAVISVTPLIIVALQSHNDPLMPANDFLIGAPLMGYANHLARILHLPVASLNPVTHASLSLKSLLIIPYFVFHIVRFILLDPRLIAATVAIIFIRPKSELSLLLAIMIPVGLFLPVLYSPAWYPLALSFYAPFVSLQAAVLLVAINWQSIAHRNVPKIAVALLLCVCVAKGLYDIVDADRTESHVITADFVQAMEAVGEKTPQNIPILSHRFDLTQPYDESYFWYAALSGRTIWSEGAKYGALLGAVADLDPVKGLHRAQLAERVLRDKRELVDSVYHRRGIAYVFAKGDPAYPKYILIDHTIGDSLPSDPSLDSAFRFDTVFSNSTVTLLR